MKKVSKYNVVTTNPAKDSKSSIPLGNGDIGVNVWVEENGDILFYLRKTDSWNENMRLLKLGKIRVRLTPNPIEKSKLFHQELKLNEGMLEIKFGENLFTVKLWVDANNPVVHMEISGSEATDTWDENCRLLKVGKVRVKLNPNPFKKGMQFCQTLNLIHGEILIKANDTSSDNIHHEISILLLTKQADSADI